MAILCNPSAGRRSPGRDIAVVFCLGDPDRGKWREVNRDLSVARHIGPSAEGYHVNRTVKESLVCKAR